VKIGESEARRVKERMRFLIERPNINQPKENRERVSKKRESRRTKKEEDDIPIDRGGDEGFLIDLEGVNGGDSEKRIGQRARRGVCVFAGELELTRSPFLFVFGGMQF
jgi:hypothetical protein